MPSPADSLAEAWRHHDAGRAFEAAALCHRVLAGAPQTPAAQHLLGIIAQGLGHGPAAVDWMCKAVAGDAATARYHDDLATAYRALGRHDEAVASHRRAAALAPDWADAHANLGKTLRAQGRLGAAAAALRRALALMPDRAATHFDLGNVHAAQGARPGAAACYRRALALAPGFTDAHTNLGLMEFGEGRFAAAERCYRQALACDPDSAAAHNNLGNARERQGDVMEAASCFERAAALDPRYVAPRINLGNLLLERGEPAAARGCYHQALALAPTQVEAHQNLGLVELMLGDYGSGWPEWRWPAPTARRFAVPEWRGEALAGAPILLHAEQGFGDTLHFVRYVPLVAQRGGRVILEVQPELRDLLATIDGADIVLGCGEALPEFAWHCPLLSLPLAVGTEVATIPAAVPYVTAPAALPVRRVPGERLRVGLVWAGRPQHNRDRHRSLHLGALAPLGRVAGVAFRSLQKGEAAGQIAGDGTALGLVDAPASLGDFGTTAAAVAALDLVITVDTAVAHLAGALGKPVWLMLSAVPDWRWLLGRDDSPWYPTARLFRQDRPGDWEPVVSRIAAALAERVAATPRRSDP